MFLYNIYSFYSLTRFPRVQIQFGLQSYNLKNYLAILKIDILSLPLVCFSNQNYAKISRIAKNELFMSFSPQQR